MIHINIDAVSRYLCTSVSETLCINYFCCITFSWSDLNKFEMISYNIWYLKITSILCKSYYFEEYEISRNTISIVLFIFRLYYRNIPIFSMIMILENNYVICIYVNQYTIQCSIQLTHFKMQITCFHVLRTR